MTQNNTTLENKIISRMIRNECRLEDDHMIASVKLTMADRDKMRIYAQTAIEAVCEELVSYDMFLKCCRNNQIAYDNKEEVVVRTLKAAADKLRGE